MGISVHCGGASVRGFKREERATRNEAGNPDATGQILPDPGRFFPPRAVSRRPAKMRIILRVSQIAFGAPLMPSKKVIVIAVAIVAAPILAIAWWLLSPLVINTEVDEEFPFSASAEIPPEMTRAEAESVMVGISKLDMPPMAEPMPTETPEFTAVAAGRFRDADSFHRGSGSATIYRQADGGGVLRLEDFRVTNGPDLRVILTPSANPERRGDVLQDGHVRLGRLKGNIGDQNYEIPPGADLDSFGSAVIYCMPFSVVFSVATFE